jgi:hypothetical protein
VVSMNDLRVDDAESEKFTPLPMINSGDFAEDSSWAALLTSDGAAMVLGGDEYGAGSLGMDSSGMSQVMKSPGMST